MTSQTLASSKATSRCELMDTNQTIRIGQHEAFQYMVAIESSRGAGQDRATVVHVPGGLVIALADGAGGTANGALAASAVIDAVQERPASDPMVLLDELDDPERLGRGETTAVIASVRCGSVFGASVGDSGAWLIEGTSTIDLTRAQRRKPLLGAMCIPIAFSDAFTASRTLLVASDGLFRYAKPADIARVAQLPDLAEAARALIELVRLPSKALQDDASIVLCRYA